MWRALISRLRKRRTESRHRRGPSRARASLRVEPLEDRRLLAIDIPLVELQDDGEFDTVGFALFSNTTTDRAGFSVTNGGDLNGDGFDDVVIGSPVDHGVPAGLGRAYVIHGKADGFQDLTLESLDEADGFSTFGINSGDHAGFSVSGAGDLNGDGLHDLLAGAPSVERETLFNAGQGYVVFGDNEPFTFDDLNGANGFAMLGLAEGDRAGFAVSGAGDVNGDGYADVLIGAPADDPLAVTGIGVAYLAYGSPGPHAGSLNLWELTGDTGLAFHGLAFADHLGSAVSGVGDLNGDGFDDFAVTAPYADSNGTGSGSAYVIFGGESPAAGVNLLDGSNGFRLDGFLPFDRAGFSISSAGDFNGDGFDDLIVGAPGDRANPRDPFDYSNPTGPGQAYIVFGTDEEYAPVINLATLNGSGDGFAIQGIDGLSAPGFGGVDYAGFSVSSAGDVDGDGFDDVIIGAPYVDSETTTGIGASYVVFGRAHGFEDGLLLGNLADDEGIVLAGDRPFERSGYSVSSAGDINGDGFDDVVIGAPVDLRSNGAAGRAYVLLGRDFRNLATEVGDASADSLVGDANANTLIGGRADDTLQGSGGADVLRGGEGDDELSIGDLTFARVVGGRGTDTLALDGTGLQLDLGAIADNRITGVEQIDLRGSGSNGLTIGNVREVLNLSDTSNQLLVKRDLDDTVDRGTGWTAAENEVIDGDTYRVYEQGAARLLELKPPPSVDLNGDNDGGVDFDATYVEDASAVAIVDSDLTVEADATIDAASIMISNLGDVGSETLAVDVTGTSLQASFDAIAGILTLSGTASTADYQQVLRTLTYQNSSQSPRTTARLVTVVVDDGEPSEAATATVSVVAVNDAPVLNSTPAPTVTAIAEDERDSSGDTVAAIVADGSMGDADGPAVEAIAVVAVDDSNGTWQYTTGSSFVDFGTPATASARLLDATATIRFVPDTDYFGTATIEFRAWDQTSGVVGDVADTADNGGTTAFSVATVTATITVNSVNDAPVLNDIFSPTFTPIPEDATDPAGEAVGAIVVDGSVSDVDGPLDEGLAIVEVDDTNGQWQHSVDGQTWTAISAAEDAALLLAPDQLLRFVPDSSFTGLAMLRFRAWDGSTGSSGDIVDTTDNGGSSAFSEVSDLATILVEEVDDLPTLDAVSTPVILGVGAMSRTIDLTGISDGDSGTETLAVTAASNNDLVLPDPVVTYTPSQSTATLTLAPSTTEAGWAIVTVTVTEADGDSTLVRFSVSVGDNREVWRNPTEASDVNGDGIVAPLDVLLIINELISPQYIDAGSALPFPPPVGDPPPFLDPSGDGLVTPFDVLLVINRITGVGNGEGEGRARIHLSATTRPVPLDMVDLGLTSDLLALVTPTLW